MLKEIKFNQSSYQNTQGSYLSIILQSVKVFQNFKFREKLMHSFKNKQISKLLYKSRHL